MTIEQERDSALKMREDCERRKQTYRAIIERCDRDTRRGAIIVVVVDAIVIIALVFGATARAANPCTMPNCTCDCHVAPTTVPVTQPSVLTVHVGSAYPIKTLAQAIVMANVGKVRIALANETFALPGTWQIAGSGVCIDSEDPANPGTIDYAGAWQAIELTNNASAGNAVRNVIIKTTPGQQVFAVKLRGDHPTVENVTVYNGGIVQTEAGCTVHFPAIINCKQAGATATKYFGYFGGAVDHLLIDGATTVPQLIGANIRLMTVSGSVIRNSTLVQEWPTGQRAQAIQLRGRRDLLLENCTIKGRTTGAIEVGWLPDEAGAQWLTDNVVIRKCNIEGYINIQPGATKVLFENNVIDSGPGAGGYAISLKGDQKFWHNGIQSLVVTGRPHGSATFVGNTIKSNAGGTLFSGAGYATIGAGNTFNGRALAPTSQPSTQP